MTAPSVPSFDEWKRRKEFDAWKASRQAEQPPATPQRSSVSNLMRGGMLGMGTAGASTVGAIGTLTGSQRLKRFGEETEREMREFYDPQGAAGTAGQVVGRLAGEVVGGVVGGGAGVKAATKLSPRVASALAGASRAKRGAAVAAANLPIDVVQGAKEEEGLVLPGRVGAVAENIGLTGIAGGLLPAARAVTAPSPAPAKPRVEIPTPATPTQAGEDYLNVARITDDPDLQRRLAENAAIVAEEGGVAARKPRRYNKKRERLEKLGQLVEPEPLDVVRAKAAETFGMPTAQFLDVTEKGQRVGRVELLAAERTMAQLTEESNRLFEQVRSGALVGLERERAIETAARLQRESLDLFGAYSKQVTETARDLSALRAGIRGTDNPLVWQARLEQLAKRPLTVEEMADAAQLAQAGDREGLLALAQRVQKFTTKDKALTMWKAGMLSSPKTQLANFFGNATMQALEAVKDIPAVITDRLLARFMANGVETKAFSPSRTFAAMMRGADQGWKDAQKVWRTGVVDAAKVDIPREVTFGTGFGGRLATGMTRAIFRGMEAVDQVFLQMSFARSLDEQARVLAKSEGFTGSGLTQRVEEILKNPPMEMSADAMLAAKVATFRNDTQLTRAVLNFREQLGPVGHILAPFAKTPLNIGARVIDYSPIGMTGAYRRLFSYVLRGTPDAALQRKIVEDVGRGSIGSGLIMLGYLAAQSGKMTGFYPSDERTRNEWRVTGKAEGALRVGDNWVQINRLSPFGNLMQIGAAMHDLETKPNIDTTDAIIGAFTAPAQTIVELPMVSGVRDVLEVAQKFGTPQAGEAARQFAGRFSSSLVPASGLLRSVAQGTDPLVRDPRSQSALTQALQTMQSGIPGLSQQLPVRRDPLGQPVRRDATLPEAIFSPVRRQSALTAEDPVRAELERTGAVVSPAERRKGESDAEYRAREQATGEAVYQMLGRVIANPAYQRAQTMNIDRIRRILDDAGVDTARLPEDRIRARYQGYLLERRIRDIKTQVARRYPNPMGGQRGALIQAITR